MAVNNLKTVSLLAKESIFTEAQIRWWIFKRDENGLSDSGAICRISNRIYLDSEKFNDWVSGAEERGIPKHSA